MDHQTPSAGLQEQVPCPDGQLWVGRGDPTIQGTPVIQGLSVAHPSLQLLG